MIQRTVKGVMYLIFVLLAVTTAYARIELHLADVKPDSDTAYETVGVESANGTLGLLTFYTKHLGLFEDSKVINRSLVYKTNLTYGYGQESIAFNWTTLTNLTNISLTDDQLSNPINLSFNENFFGDLATNFKISSNGFITFSNGTNHGCCAGSALPASSEPNMIVAGWWEDLNPELGGSIGYQNFTFGNGKRMMVVQFDNIQHYAGGSNVSFQIKIIEE